MRRVLLALLVALSAPAHGQHAHTSIRPSGGLSRVFPAPAVVARASGIDSFAASWGDWPAGTPSPTVGCVAAASGGDLACTGATATKVGAPTTVPAWGWPARSAVRLTGSTSNYYNLGDVAKHPANFSGCAAFTVATTASTTRALASKRDLTLGHQWMVFAYGRSFYLRVYKNTADYDTIATTGLAVGTSNVACWAYEYVADGTSRLRMNLNGATVPEVTDAVGPLQTSTAPVLIGADIASGVSNPWNGDITVYTDWDGIAPSNAELAALVASQQARLAVRPSSTVLTGWGSAVPCAGPDGTLHSLPAGVPCVEAGGAGVWGAAEKSNLLADSDPAGASWTHSNVADTATSAACPLWVDGVTRMTLLEATDADPYSSIDAANSRCRGVWLALATGDSAFDVTVSDASGDGAEAVTLSATPTRVMQTATGQTGIKLAWATGRLCAMRATGQNTAVCTEANPAVAAAGTPVTGTPDQGNRPLQSDVTDSRGCVGAQYKLFPPAANNAKVLAFNTGNSAIQVRNNGAGFGSYDGTSSLDLVIADAAATTARVASCWSGSARTLYDLNAGTAVSGAYDGSMIGNDGKLHIGHNGASANNLNGAVFCTCQGKNLQAIRECFRQCDAREATP